MSQCTPAPYSSSCQQMCCVLSCAGLGSPTPPAQDLPPLQQCKVRKRKTMFLSKRNFFYFSFLIGFSVSHSSHSPSLVGNSGLCKAQKDCSPRPLAGSPAPLPSLPPLLPVCLLSLLLTPESGPLTSVHAWTCQKGQEEQVSVVWNA